MKKKLPMAAYILIAIRLEERDLVSAFGGDYVAYRSRTPMLIPGIGSSGGATLASGPAGSRRKEAPAGRPTRS